MGVEIKTNKSSAPKRLVIAAAITALIAGFTAPAYADFAEDLLDTLRAKGTISEDEYQDLLKKMRAERKADAMQNAQAAEAAEKAQKEVKAMSVSKTNVNIKLGGFIEAATVYRNENEGADVGSLYIPKAYSNAAAAYSGIPYPNSLAAQTPELRETARQSRISLLATGNLDDKTTASAYFVADFLGDAQTGNTNQSNSYTPRIREGYATWDNSDWGIQFLAGQTWSMVTQYKDGITPRDENIPLTIDAQYSTGFNWLRVPQIRVDKYFDDKKYWVGLSAEQPQVQLAGQQPSYFTAPTSNAGANGLGGNAAVGNTFTELPLCAANGSATCAIATLAASGGSLNNTANTYTIDDRPDLILKGAADPGWGHYELYGVYRWFTDRVNTPSLGYLAGPSTGSGTNVTTTGEGIGGSVLLPVVPKMLSLSGSFLTGNGIGRYGTSGLPDATYNLNGSLATIHGTDFLLGAIFNPVPEWQIWGYYGKEIANQTVFSNTGFSNPIIYGNTKGLPATPAGAVGYLPAAVTQFSGYGLPYLDNYGCEVNPARAVALAANCAAAPSQISSYQMGVWWDFYKGTYGTMKWGASFNHVEVGTYAGAYGAPNPSINIYMLSFRYYPFQ